MSKQPTPPLPKIERRYFHGAVEHRASLEEGGDGFDFGGLASRVGNEYVLFEWGDTTYVEEIAPGAFDDVLQDDVRVLFNHKDSHILGRTKSSTAKIWVDKDGLRYAWKNPETSYATDLAVSIRRKDIDQSSFGFNTSEDNCDYSITTDEATGKRKHKRTIKKFTALYDCSPVTYPANPDTETDEIRSLFQAAEQRSNQRPPADEEGWESDIFLKMAELNDKRRAMML